MVLYGTYRTMDTGCFVLCLGLAKRTGGTMLIPGIPHPAQQGRDRSGDAGFQRDTNVIETAWRSGVRRLITRLKLYEALMHTQYGFQY